MTNNWEVFSLSAPDGDGGTVGFVARRYEPGIRYDKRGMFRRSKVEVEFLESLILFLGTPEIRTDGLEYVTPEIRDEHARGRFIFQGVEYVAKPLEKDEAERVFREEFA